MLNKALFFLVLISLAALADAKEKSIETIKLMQVVSGELTSYQNFPSQFIKPRNIHVWTPDSYSAEKQYDVLMFMTVKINLTAKPPGTSKNGELMM